MSPTPVVQICSFNILSGVVYPLWPVNTYPYDQAVAVCSIHLAVFDSLGLENFGNFIHGIC